MYVSGGTFLNVGTATIDATATLSIYSGATVTNSGTITMEFSSEINGNNSPNAVFNNTGTLVVNTGTTKTATLYGALVVNNTGSLQLTSGTFDVSSATLNLNGGSVTGAGVLENQGTLGINSSQSLSTLAQSGGSLQIAAGKTLTVSSLTDASGSLQLSAGDPSQFGRLVVSGSVPITGMSLYLNTSFTPSCGTSLTALKAGGVSGTWSVSGSSLPTSGMWTPVASATSAGATVSCSSPTSAPTVTGVTPGSGPIAGGTVVTINGSGFTGATSVSFGTTSASFTIVSDSQISATSPPGAIGVVAVTVTGPGGTSALSSADNFTYATGPVISTVNPTSGSVAGGTSVTISGSGFTGTSAVKFGSSPASLFVINSDTQITAVSPPEVAGTVDITVATPGGTSATSPLDSFSFSTSVGCSETWTGATDSHWSTASNWSNGQVPSYNDEACIPSGAPNLPVVLDAGTSPSIRGLAIRDPWTSRETCRSPARVRCPPGPCRWRAQFPDPAPS